MYEELIKQLRNRRMCIQGLGTLNDYPLLGEAADAIEELSRVLDSYERSAKEWAEEAYRAYRKYSESIFGSPKEG